MAPPRKDQAGKKDPDPDLIALGRRLASLRQEAGLSQEALGAVADLHWTYVGRVERGTVSPSFRNLLKLARGLGVAPTRLMPDD
jgi:transcriptional regulator with XRE-family HTH domain